MKTYSVKVDTSRNTFFVWEIEDSSIANVASRIQQRLRGLDVVNVVISEMKDAA